MNFSTIHYANGMSKIIELVVKNGDNQIIADITNMHGKVDIGFIDNLRLLAEELERSNIEVDKAQKNSVVNFS